MVLGRAAVRARRLLLLRGSGLATSRPALALSAALRAGPAVRVAPSLRAVRADGGQGRAQLAPVVARAQRERVACAQLQRRLEEEDGLLGAAARAAQPEGAARLAVGRRQRRPGRGLPAEARLGLRLGGAAELELRPEEQRVHSAGAGGSHARLRVRLREAAAAASATRVRGRRGSLPAREQRGRAERPPRKVLGAHRAVRRPEPVELRHVRAAHRPAHAAEAGERFALHQGPAQPDGARQHGRAGREEAARARVGDDGGQARGERVRAQRVDDEQVGGPAEQPRRGGGGGRGAVCPHQRVARPLRRGLAGGRAGRRELKRGGLVGEHGEPLLCADAAAAAARRGRRRHARGRVPRRELAHGDGQQRLAAHGERGARAQRDHRVHAVPLARVEHKRAALRARRGVRGRDRGADRGSPRARVRRVVEGLEAPVHEEALAAPARERPAPPALRVGVRAQRHQQAVRRVGLPPGRARQVRERAPAFVLPRRAAEHVHHARDGARVLAGARERSRELKVDGRVVRGRGLRRGAQAAQRERLQRESGRPRGVRALRGLPLDHAAEVRPHGGRRARAQPGRRGARLAAV